MLLEIKQTDSSALSSLSGLQLRSPVRPCLQRPRESVAYVPCTHHQLDVRLIKMGGLTLRDPTSRPDLLLER
jgi:hypothetical protein